MRNIIPFEDRKPCIARSAYIDPHALIIGEVTIEDNVTIWPGVVIRADEESVTIEENSAVMDIAFIEAPKGKPVKVESNSLVSHGARLHGCTVGEEVLIGIGAIVLDGAEIGDRCIVAAGSVVPPGSVFPKSYLIKGAPAQRSRRTKKSEVSELERILKDLRRKAKRYRKQYETWGKEVHYIL